MSIPELADLPPILTVPEVAEVLRVGKSALYESIQQGRFPALRIGRKIRISRAALIEALERGANPASGDTASNVVSMNFRAAEGPG